MKKNTMCTICVIDGQGGGIGSTIIRKLKEKFGEAVEILALGTNAIATAQMLKSRANRGACGVNAIVHTVKTACVIIGSVGIIMPHAMMGELSCEMAEAIAVSPAKKILVPLTQENIEIAGLCSMPLPMLVDELIDKQLTLFLQDYEEV